MVCPYTSKTVCLQFNLHAHLVCLVLGEFSHLSMSLTQITQQILHVVTHFMGNHIGIGEVAISTQ